MDLEFMSFVIIFYSILSYSHITAMYYFSFSFMLMLKNYMYKEEEEKLPV